MSLSQSTLKNELLKLCDPQNPSFAGYPVDVPTAAANFAAAYDAYATKAANAGGASLTSKHPDAFKAKLAAQLPAAATGTAALAAAAFDAAFIAYWTGATFATAPPPPAGVGGDGVFGVVASSVVSAVAAGVLAGRLSPLLAIPTTDPAARADALAAAFHAATTSAVTVVTAGTDTTPPPTGPLPITNTAGIQ